MKKPTYSGLKAELDEVLDKIQSPDTELDEAIELHKKGKKILSSLESYLEEVSQKIDSEIKKKPA